MLTTRPAGHAFSWIDIFDFANMFGNVNNPTIVYISLNYFMYTDYYRSYMTII